MFAPRKTQLVSNATDSEDTIVVPMKSREDLPLDRTNLLSRLAEIWGEIPIRLIQHLDLKNGVYGFVGMRDRTMYPIIRPGSIVHIDQNQKKILPVKWENEHERPIYFIELRGEYICSWCEMRGGVSVSDSPPELEMRGSSVFISEGRRNCRASHWCYDAPGGSTLVEDAKRS